LLFQTRQAAHSGLSQVADVAFQGTTCTDQVSHMLGAESHSLCAWVVITVCLPCWGHKSASK